MTLEISPVDACPMCGSSARAPVLEAEGGLGVVRCHDCGLVHATGQYAAEFLSDDYYASRAVHARSSGGECSARERSGSERKRRNVALYDRLSGGRIGRGGGRGDGRALDIGCNIGLLLDIWRELGYHAEGIERSPAGEHAQAAGHVVHALDIETQELSLPRYDLISMTHVLEHLRQPTAGLMWVRRHLTADGLAVVEVPNWGDRLRALWGRRYRPLELGDHVSFFERATLKKAAERAGLTVRAMWSAPQAGSLVVPSLLTALDLGLGLRAWLSGILRPAASAATPGSGVASSRLVGGNQASSLRRAVTPLALAALDRLDPPLERFFGPECSWGANLVVILEAAHTGETS